MDLNNAQSAFSYFKKAFEIDPTDGVIYYEMNYCKCYLTDLSALEIVTHLKDCLLEVFDLIISEKIDDEIKQNKLIYVADRFIQIICISIVDSAMIAGERSAFTANTNDLKLYVELKNNGIDSLYLLGNILEKKCLEYENVLPYMIEAWTKALDFLNKRKDSNSKRIKNELSQKISKYNIKRVNIPYDERVTKLEKKYKRNKKINLCSQIIMVAAYILGEILLTISRKYYPVAFELAKIILIVVFIEMISILIHLKSVRQYKYLFIKC